MSEPLDQYRDLAERAVVALHMFRHAGIRGPLFTECRQGLCKDWHALEAARIPNDDATPILDNYASGDEWRDPWLLAVGFVPDDHQDYLWAPKVGEFYLLAMAAGPWRMVCADDEVEIPRPRTRGDVRLLCRALGVELPGDKTTPSKPDRE